MPSLSGKVIIITGAAGNLGGCIADLLAARGAKLVLSDINEEALVSRVEIVNANREAAIACVADVTSEADLRGLMDVTVSVFGGVDVLVNNAGLIGQEVDVGLVNLDVDLWERTIDINLKSVFLACKLVIPHLIARGGGSILNISSDSSMIGNLTMSAYGASKGGINALTRYIAAQHGKDHVRCNAVLPGIHLDEAAVARTPIESLQKMTDHCMLPRLGVPEDIAKLVAFLASDDAYYITAQLLQVDGGLIDHAPHYADTRRDGIIYRSAPKKG